MELNQLITREVENLALANSEKKSGSVEAIDLNTNRAQVALSDKQINACTEDEVNKKLELIYSMIGLRPTHFPFGQEEKDLNHYVRLKYGLKTLSELVLAFDLAINDELDLSPDDVKVYDQFTIAYLSRIMSAYKKWLFEINKKRQPKPAMMLEEKKELTLQEKQTWIAEWKEKINNPLDKTSFQLIPIVFYEYLHLGNYKDNLVTAMDMVRSFISEENISEVDKSRKLAEFKKQEVDGFEGEFKNLIITTAMRISIFNNLKTK